MGFLYFRGVLACAVQDDGQWCEARVGRGSDVVERRVLRKPQHLLGIRHLSDAPSPLQPLAVEEAQSGQPLRDRVRRQLPGAQINTW